MPLQLVGGEKEFNENIKTKWCTYNWMQGLGEFEWLKHEKNFRIVNKKEVVLRFDDDNGEAFSISLFVVMIEVDIDSELAKNLKRKHLYSGYEDPVGVSIEFGSYVAIKPQDFIKVFHYIHKKEKYKDDKEERLISSSIRKFLKKDAEEINLKNPLILFGEVCLLPFTIFLKSVIS